MLKTLEKKRVKENLLNQILEDNQRINQMIRQRPIPVNSRSDNTDQVIMRSDSTDQVTMRSENTDQDIMRSENTDEVIMRSDSTDQVIMRSESTDEVNMRSNESSKLGETEVVSQQTICGSLDAAHHQE